MVSSTLWQLRYISQVKKSVKPSGTATSLAPLVRTPMFAYRHLCHKPDHITMDNEH